MSVFKAVCILSVIICMGMAPMLAVPLRHKK